MAKWPVGYCVANTRNGLGATLGSANPSETYPAIVNMSKKPTNKDASVSAVQWSVCYR